MINYNLVFLPVFLKLCFNKLIPKYEVYIYEADVSSSKYKSNISYLLRIRKSKRKTREVDGFPINSEKE